MHETVLLAALEPPRVDLTQALLGTKIRSADFGAPKGSNGAEVDQGQFWFEGIGLLTS